MVRRRRPIVFCSFFYSVQSFSFCLSYGFSTRISILGSGQFDFSLPVSVPSTACEASSDSDHRRATSGSDLFSGKPRRSFNSSTASRNHDSPELCQTLSFGKQFPQTRSRIGLAGDRPDGPFSFASPMWSIQPPPTFPISFQVELNPPPSLNQMQIPHVLLGAWRSSHSKTSHAWRPISAIFSFSFSASRAEELFITGSRRHVKVSQTKLGHECTKGFQNSKWAGPINLVSCGVSDPSFIMGFKPNGLRQCLYVAGPNMLKSIWPNPESDISSECPSHIRVSPQVLPVSYTWLDNIAGDSVWLLSIYLLSIVSQNTIWTRTKFLNQSSMRHPDRLFPLFPFSSCCGHERLFYVSSFSKERTLILVSLFIRGVLLSLDLSMKVFYLLTILLSSVMVHTGSVETTNITPVRTEVSELVSKSLFMCTKLRSVVEIGSKNATLTNVLVLESFDTSPGDLSKLHSILIL